MFLQRINLHPSSKNVLCLIKRLNLIQRRKLFFNLDIHPKKLSLFILLCFSFYRRKRPKPGQRTNVSVAVDNLPIFRIMAENPIYVFLLRSMFICFNRFLCMIMNNNEFEANNHGLKHNNTLPSDPFLLFADFDVHEKDSARSE